MVNIYILKLENNKYYIGKTYQSENKLKQYFNSPCSVWRKQYKPVKVLEFIDNCNKCDEDKYTLEYMEKYGINKVRGGSYRETKLNEKQIETIKKMISCIDTINNNCWMCGSKDHFIKDCGAGTRIGDKDKVPTPTDSIDTIDTIDTIVKCNCISSFLKPYERKNCLINNIIQRKETFVFGDKQQIIDPSDKQHSVDPCPIPIPIPIPNSKLYYCNYCNKDIINKDPSNKETCNKCWECGKTIYYLNKYMLV